MCGRTVKEKGLVVVLNAQTEPGNGWYTLNEPMPTQDTIQFWQILQRAGT